MLGELLAEESGKTSGMRVLPADGYAPRTEVSYQASGRFLGHEGTDMGTYTSVLTPDGTLHGEGQGILMTRDGGTATWRGEGRGRFSGRGSAVSWRGAIYYQTTSPQLDHLKDVVGVFEFEVDENGNTRGKVWEWK